MTSVLRGDEPNVFDEPSTADALRVMLVAIFSSALAISMFTLFLRWRLTPDLALLAGASSLVAIVWSRSGRVRRAILLPLVSITYAVLHLAVRSDGIQNVGLAILPVLIVVASLVLERLTLAFYTAGTILAVFGMLSIRYFVLRVERYSTNDMGDFFIFALTCATAALVGRLLAERIQESFQLVRDSESRYRRIFDNVQDVYYEMGADGILLELSPASSALFGVPREKMIGHTLAPFCVNLSEYEALLAALRKHGRVTNHELVIGDSRTKCRHVLINASSHTVFKTGEEKMIGSIRDITERKRLEEELRQRAEELQKIMDVAPVALFVAHDSDCHEVTGNRTANALAEAAEGANMSISAPGDAAQPWHFFRDGIEIPVQEMPLQVAARGVEVRECELEMLALSGTRRLLWGHASPLRDADGRVRGAVAALQDITAGRQRTDALLLESEERFRNAANAAPVMIWVSDLDKLCTFFNKPWLDFTGRTMQQELGNGWADGVHPEDLDRCFATYSSAFDSHRSFQMEYRLRRADGEYRWVLDHGVPRFAPDGAFAGYIGSCIDITDLKRTHEVTLARQKLESLGAVASGIAHDFNNLLGGILVQAEVMEMDLSRGSSSPSEEIRRIRAATRRGAEIVRELMIYAGQGQTGLSEPVDLSRLVEEMVELLKVSISKHAVLRTNLDKDLPAVWSNASQIRQVVMNLVINASEAIGEKDGAIGVTTIHVSGGEDLAPNNATDLPQGHYLRLEVTDTGCGIPEEAQAKILDPFFSTKFAGRGLGLAVVQGIVRAHGGAINLMSTPGQGTTFQVLLPCASMEALETQSHFTLAGVERSNAWTGTILVVEDEESLRLAVSKALRKRGFSVVEASDGFAAMNLIRTHKDNIDVIVLDFTIPGRSSREVFEEAQRTRSDLKVILTSAYGKETVDAAFTGLQVEHFIRKPFQLGDLVDLLQGVLSG